MDYTTTMNAIDKTVQDLKFKISEKMVLEEKIKKERKRFFISDLHFGDERLNLYGRDLLFKNSKEVDEYIIDRWNQFVKPHDLVVVVGDISMTKDGLENLLKCNGEKWLVKGNYDTSVEDGGTAKYEVNDKLLSKYFSKIVDDIEIEINGESVFVNHYPVKMKKEQFNICGQYPKTYNFL